MDIEQLGVTREQLLELVVAKIVDRIEDRNYGDFDGGIAERVRKTLESGVQLRITQKVDEHLVSVFQDLITNTPIFQPTTRYGEKQQALSFSEYLCKMAREHLTQNVDYEGRDENSSYGNRDKRPRIVWMVHQHLQHEVTRAVEGILKGAHEILGTSIQAVVTDALKRVEASIKVQVK